MICDTKSEMEHLLGGRKIDPQLPPSQSKGTRARGAAIAARARVLGMRTPSSRRREVRYSNGYMVGFVSFKAWTRLTIPWGEHFSEVKGKPTDLSTSALKAYLRR